MITSYILLLNLPRYVWIKARHSVSHRLRAHGCPDLLHRGNVKGNDSSVPLRHRRRRRVVPHHLVAELGLIITALGHRNTLRDKLLQALELVFLQQLVGVCVHHYELQATGARAYPRHDLLMAVAVHALSIHEHQPVARAQTGHLGGGVGLHQADELAALALLSVQMEAVSVLALLQDAETRAQSLARHHEKSPVDSIWQINKNEGKIRVLRSDVLTDDAC